MNAVSQTSPEVDQRVKKVVVSTQGRRMFLEVLRGCTINPGERYYVEVEIMEVGGKLTLIPSGEYLADGYELIIYDNPLAVNDEPDASTTQTQT
jgi:hypothetical protein